MILFVAGYPLAGKSEFCHILCEELQKEERKIPPELISPAEWQPDNYDQLPEPERREYAISAWEVAIERTQQAITNKRNRNSLIILDTAASKLLTMRPLFHFARLRGHHVIYAIISSDLADRQSRTTRDLSLLEEEYTKAFRESIPALKRVSDTFLVIKNPNDPERVGLHDAAKRIANLVGSLGSCPNG